MDMMFPLVDSGAIMAERNLLLALVLGLAFGWLLERGGMGSARKIAAQFTLTDLSVLKIMFSAILTTAMGLYWFAKAGWVDFESLFVEPTYLWPQLLGAVLFGAGFVIGGLCPGTACVAMASGRLDGAVLLAGLLVGIGLFNAAFPAIESLYRSGSVGVTLLPDVLGISIGQTLLALTLLALAAFWIAERIEARRPS